LRKAGIFEAGEVPLGEEANLFERRARMMASAIQGAVGHEKELGGNGANAQTSKFLNHWRTSFFGRLVTRMPTLKNAKFEKKK
jgi:hypothetical protein